MPNDPLLPFAESPDGLSRGAVVSSHANMPGPPGSSMTPHGPTLEKAGMQTKQCSPIFCMFCDETFHQQSELRPHVLSQHPTTLFEPSVLCAEAEFRITEDRARPVLSTQPTDKDQVFSCILCGQVSQDASELENHLRKHKDYFTYCCSVCGRRFREPWFLKNHMKMHGSKPGAKKAQQDLESPSTINGVTQGPNAQPVATLYEMCMVCGFFYPDHDSLAEHSKVHNREVEPGRVNQSEGNKNEQETFMERFKLRPHSAGENTLPERSSKWIPQLDPFNTYQAWQLATKGKIAVGPSNIKDLGLDASTDNEDCNSDKEELANIWTESQADKSLKEGLGRKLRSQRQTAVETPSPEPDHRSLIQRDKARPTTCEECGRQFRTYHQLVLHSRVHKREQEGASPTGSLDGKPSKAGMPDNTEEGLEDGSEEVAVTEAVGSGEFGFDRSKVRSRQCSYCSKTFRSSYYLTIHLRTHTGEKPFKCMYCDYAAAQKNSLKYHLDRRHKELLVFSNEPVSPAPSPTGKEEELAPVRAKLWVPLPKPYSNGKLENPSPVLVGDGATVHHPVVPVNKPVEKVSNGPDSTTANLSVASCLVPIDLKMKPEMREQSSDAPLNFSLKVSHSISTTCKPQNALISNFCPYCAFKTLYPEVLVMHRNLSHKSQLDVPKKPRPSLKLKRFTGCPPALKGNDVTPLCMMDRRHPRRTKSPTPQAGKPRSQSALPPLPTKGSPIPAPMHKVTPDVQIDGAKTEQQPSRDSVQFTEVLKRSGNSKHVVDAYNPSDRVGIGERSYSVRADVEWYSGAARLCLSSRFGSLPQMDLGESSNKRFKYCLPQGREADPVEKQDFRAPTADGANRLLGSGRSMKTLSQSSAPATVSEVPGPAKSLPVGGGSMDTDWNIINILRSHTPADLATLYHGAPAFPCHGGLANPRDGNRSSLYQHLPNLPHLQRLEHSASSFPGEHYGTADKS